jgi:hypothetical protein
MPICKNGLEAVRKLWKGIDDTLETVIDEVIDITGKIKAIEGNPTVEFIISLIPQGSEIEAWANAAIDKIIVVSGEVKTVAEKITAWLDGKTELEKNADLLKLASTMTAVAHGNKQPEHFYDSAVQLHIITNRTV